MVLALGIRLVIVFPTLLFLVGCIFKFILDRKSFKGITEESNLAFLDDLFRNSTLILAINSIFLFMANGLIFMFQLGQEEIGITAMICGVLFSICLIVAVYAEDCRAELIAAKGIFGILSGELAYFCTYDGLTEFIWNINLYHYDQQVDIPPTLDLCVVFCVVVFGALIGSSIGSRIVVLHKGT